MTKQQTDAAIEQRIRAIHSRTCDKWHSWTEYNQPLYGGGRADITFDGCRQHGVALARDKESDGPWTTSVEVFGEI